MLFFISTPHILLKIQLPIVRLFLSLSLMIEESLPQRLHRVCDLLWRFPKLEVPLAVIC